MADAATEGNLLQGTLAANQPNLWKSEVYALSLTAGTAEYDLPARMIAIQDIYLTTTSGGTSTDRMLFPMSLFEYDAQPNKTQQSPPTTYMIQKTLTPSITFWQVPDDSATYVANVRMLSQTEDVSQVSGTTLDLPYTFLDVYVAGLAYRMARVYAPDKEQMRKQDYQEAWEAAARTDTQDSVSLYISPSFAGYWR